MDNIFKLLENHPRKLNSNFKLELAGYHADKVEQIDRTYTGCNFSIILKGQGSYSHLGKKYSVNAPCVIIQWPEEHAVYGPDKGTTWEELYLIYPPASFEKLLQRKFLSYEKPYWEFGNKHTLLPLVHDFVTQLEDITPSTELDLLDLLAESIITHTLVNESATLKKDEEIILEVMREVQSHPAKEYSFDEWARQHGISPATFRRKWMKQVGMPPGKFHIQKKVEEACRLLTETNLKINAIAVQLNFADALYFRRRFKIETGLTPSQYRNRLVAD